MMTGIGMRVAIDVDGVVADGRRRVIHLPNWDRFYKDVEDDPIIPPGTWLVEALEKYADEIVWVTTRPEFLRVQTETWLKRVFGTIHGGVHMLPRGLHDKRITGVGWKVGVYVGLGLGLVVEDDPDVVRALVQAGVPVVHCRWDGGYEDARNRVMGYLQDLLTPRQMQILKLVCEGKSNKAVAAKMFLSVSTVKNHITAVFHALGVEDRTALAIKALRMGLVSLEDL